MFFLNYIFNLNLFITNIQDPWFKSHRRHKSQSVKSNMQICPLWQTPVNRNLTTQDTEILFNYEYLELIFFLGSYPCVFILVEEKICIFVPIIKHSRVHFYL